MNTTFLLEPGELARIPFAALLIEALNLRATGVLRVEHDGGTSRIFIREGIPVGSQSHAGFKPLGQILLSRGRIDAATLNESLAGMAATGRPQGEVLVEMGAVEQAEVDAALTEQQEQYLSRIASLEAGTFRFDGARAPPEWTRTIRIQPLRVIVQALEEPQAAALVASALRLAAVGPLSLADGYQRLAPAFGWSRTESLLVARLTRGIALEDFFAEPGVAQERARGILAALILLGLAQAQQAGPGAEAVPGIVVDLVDLAGVEVEPEAEPPARPSPAPRPSPGIAPDPTPPPARRSDPEEARRRRQRLLQRAMQNMGIGPLARPAPPQPAARPTGSPGATPAGYPPPTPPPGTTPPPGSAQGAPADSELRRAFEAVAPRARSPDLYVRLGLDRSAGTEQVKQAYFRLAKQLHPDRFLSPALADVAGAVKDLFAALNEAYETLSDDRRRAEYLASAAEGGGAVSSAQAQAAARDFQKGEACLRTRDFPKARAFYEAAIRANPLAEYQAALAWALYFDLKAPDRLRAKELLAQALRDPTCDRAAYAAAMVARDEGDEGAAERMFRIALRANPRHVEAEREVRLIEARRRRH